jgi:hypothetical protein
MTLNIILDTVAIASCLFSFAFWIASNYLYKDVIAQVKEIRNEVSFKTESQITTVFNRMQRSIDKIFSRVSTFEARLEYLEETQTDKLHSDFVEKISNALENSDFTNP